MTPRSNKARKRSNLTSKANSKAMVEAVISQTPNIISFLSTRVGPIDLDSEHAEASVDTEDQQPDTKRVRHSKATLDDVSHFHQQEMLLTILDVVNEAHNTHHPISTSMFYQDQKEVALQTAKEFREARLPRYFKYLETAIEKAGNGYLLKSGVSYVDLAAFQLVDGLQFAFPNWLAKIKPDYPKLFELHARIQTSPRIAQYLASDRRQPYSEYGIFRQYKELDIAEES
ncbi:BQ2448_2029 [Microbotryum intermedium]|uniref:BQ2448_2029 protein n=1 Tax=Microbotryum intermedium TaxID=269621 RepID=A0A238F8C1_9BASI|nr:BQ2448_2029 [Microbotryum intermedium]